jgi:hypothetical protein
MAGYIQYVIDAARDPVVTILIAPDTVPGKKAALER